jgi:hypothetical protein
MSIVNGRTFGQITYNNIERNNHVVFANEGDLTYPMNDYIFISRYNEYWIYNINTKENGDKFPYPKLDSTWSNIEVYYVDQLTNRVFLWDRYANELFQVNPDGTIITLVKS